MILYYSGATPQRAAQATGNTPSHTPLRDQLSINSEDGLVIDRAGFDSAKNVYQQQVCFICDVVK